MKLYLVSKALPFDCLGGETLTKAEGAGAPPPPPSAPAGGGGGGMPKMPKLPQPEKPGAGAGSASKSVDCPLGAACPDGGKHKMGSQKLQKHTKQAQAQGQTGQKLGDESSGVDAQKPGVPPGATNIGGLGSDEVQKPQAAKPGIPAEHAAASQPQLTLDPNKKKVEAAPPAMGQRGGKTSLLSGGSAAPKLTLDEGKTGGVDKAKVQRVMSSYQDAHAAKTNSSKGNTERGHVRRARDAAKDLTPEEHQEVYRQLEEKKLDKYSGHHESIVAKDANAKFAAKKQEGGANPDNVTPDGSYNPNKTMQVGDKDVQEVPKEPNKVPLMITKDQHQQLADLGYSKQDRQNMKPEEAQQILQGGATKEDPHAAKTREMDPENELPVRKEDMQDPEKPEPADSSRKTQEMPAVPANDDEPNEPPSSKKQTLHDGPTPYLSGAQAREEFKSPLTSPDSAPKESKAEDHYKLSKLASELGDHENAEKHRALGKQRATEHGLDEAGHRKLADQLNKDGMHEDAEHHAGVADRIKRYSEYDKVWEDADKEAEEMLRTSKMTDDEHLSEGEKKQKDVDGAHENLKKFEKDRESGKFSRTMAVRDAKREMSEKQEKYTKAVRETPDAENRAERDAFESAKKNHDKARTALQDYNDHHSMGAGKDKHNELKQAHASAKQAHAAHEKQAKERASAKAGADSKQPKLREPANDMEKLRHGAHQNKAKNVARNIESHLANDPTLSDEDKETLKTMHKRAVEHSTAKHMPEAEHSKELKEIERMAKEKGMDQTWEEKQDMENAQATAAAAADEHQEKQTQAKAQAKQQAQQQKQQAQQQKAHQRAADAAQKAQAKQQAQQQKQQAAQQQKAQAQQQKAQAKQQATQQKAQAKQQASAHSPPPQSPMDHAKVHEHNSRAQKMLDAVTSHLNNAAEGNLSPSDQTKLEHLQQELQQHISLGTVPSQDHQNHLKELQKLAGEHGKDYTPPKEPKDPKQPSGGGRGGSHFISTFNAGRAFGQRIGASAQSPKGADGIATAGVQYGMGGAVGAGHHLLTGGAKKQAQASEQAQKQGQQAQKQQQQQQANPQQQAGTP